MLQHNILPYRQNAAKKEASQKWENRNPNVDPYRPYRHVGVHIPFKNADAPNQWSSDDRIQEKGFIFVKQLDVNAMVVQSVQTGRLFVNKIIEPAEDVDGVGDVRKVDEPAEELRISTAPQAERILPRKLQVRGRERTYFVDLQLWQIIADGVYSLYFDFYNGGTLEQLQQYYIARRRPIPEHFIWHVLLTLIEDVRYLQTGCLPGENTAPEDWDEIYHRNIDFDNIFIHYDERPASEKEPALGWRSNAFPEIVLGNFGQASVEGDETRRIRGGRWNRAQVEPLEWEDTWAIYDTIKMLSVCHMHTVDWDESINSTSSANSIRCDDINQEIDWPNDSRYSDALIDTLQRWEYRNAPWSDIDQEQTNVHNVVTPNYDLIPTMEDLIQNVLPLARRMVRKYSKVPKDDPDLAQKWYRDLDVSWTKPTLMPYRWESKETDRLDETILRNVIHNDDDDDNNSNSRDRGRGDSRDSGDDGDDEGGGGDDSNRNKDDDSGPDKNGDDNTNKDGSGSSAKPPGDTSGSTNKDTSGSSAKPPGDTTRSDRTDSPVSQHKSSSSSSSDSGKTPDKSDRSGLTVNSDGRFNGDDDDSTLSDIPSSGSPSGSEPNGDGKNSIPAPLVIKTTRTDINPLLLLETLYPDLREPCRLVMLEYGQPLMLDIRNIPDRPYPGGPDSPPASEDDSGSSDSSDSDDNNSGNGKTPGGGGGKNDGSGLKKKPPTRPPPTRQQPPRKKAFTGNYRDLIRGITNTTGKRNPNAKKLLIQVYIIVEAEQARQKKLPDIEIPKKRKFPGEHERWENKRRGIIPRSRRAVAVH
ncbi:hypothetical protein F4678DRAFT_480089 [Xylaria arbuscula]|nr:hypothetical protein F4678DRAFT_480089 [Xylaria arbuscula]